MLSKKKIIKIASLIIAFLNAVMLLFFSLGRYNFQLFKDEEAKIMMVLTSIKSNFGKRDRPSTDSIVFINTNNIQKKYPESGNALITDRVAISNFLNILNMQKKSFQFVFFDIVLEDTTTEDEKLKNSIRPLQEKVFFVKSVITPEENLIRDVPTYHASFKKNGGKQIHFPLYYKVVGKKFLAEISAPLAMYLHRHKEALVSLPLYFDDFFIRIGNDLHFANPITEPYLNMADINISDPDGINEKVSPYRVFDMLQINEMDSTELNEVIRGKIILVGDVDVSENEHSDIHSAMVEDTKGILILFNTYWMIEKGMSKLNYFWLVLFLIFLWATSFIIIKKNYYGNFFLKNMEIRVTQTKRKNTRLNQFFTKVSKIAIFKKSWLFTKQFLSLGLLFFVISALSYFIFKIHIEILWTAVLLSIEATFLKQIRKITNVPI